jgi:hypothetical protein
LRNEDRNEDKQFHKAALARAVAEYGPKALELDLAELEIEIPTLPVEIRRVLQQTQEWLEAGGRQVEGLQEVYEVAESKRKKLRARLPRTQNGRSRRDDWDSEIIESPEEQKEQTGPLHYRWYIVRNLLNDLHGGVNGEG